MQKKRSPLRKRQKNASAAARKAKMILTPKVEDRKARSVDDYAKSGSVETEDHNFQGSTNNQERKTLGVPSTVVEDGIDNSTETEKNCSIATSNTMDETKDSTEASSSNTSNLSKNAADKSNLSSSKKGTNNSNPSSNNIKCTKIPPNPYTRNGPSNIDPFRLKHLHRD